MSSYEGPQTRRRSRGALIDISNKDEESRLASKPKRQRTSRGSAREGQDESTKSSQDLSSSSSSSEIIVLDASPDRASQEPKSETHTVKRLFPLPRKSLNPADCLDIVDDMYKTFYSLEDKYAAKPYMQKQVDITPKMRCILVDWLIEVHHKFKLREPTLWLAINIMDRYLENNFPQRAKLQLVGISAFFIACKFEEVYPPEIRECIYITDYAYEKDELLEMEKNILTALGFDIFVPTGYCFLQRYCNCIQASDRVKALASYYAERNLQESDMLQLPPHVFAAGALYAALKQQVTQYSTLLKDHKIWTRPLIEESGLRESDVIPAARQIIGHVRECPETASKRKLMAARKKFSAEKYFNVSSYTIPFIPDA